MSSDDLLEVFNAKESARLRSSFLVFGAIVVLSIAVLAYTSARVRKSLQEVALANKQIDKVRQGAIDARLEAQRNLQILKTQMQNATEATRYVSYGINNYHAGKYREAVSNYNLALERDPKNPYILDLKGYSLFKLHDYEKSVAALEESVNINPGYDWGYFDLARTQCAMQDFKGARHSIEKGISVSEDHYIAGVMRSDGEFAHVCRPIADTVRETKFAK